MRGGQRSGGLHPDGAWSPGAPITQGQWQRVALRDSGSREQKEASGTGAWLCLGRALGSELKASLWTHVCCELRAHLQCGCTIAPASGVSRANEVQRPGRTSGDEERFSSAAVSTASG